MERKDVKSTMDKEKFLAITNSLRQYRRAELKDFDKDLGNTPAIDLLYTDPLPANAILKQVLSPNTTFLLGRKGTGKSTVFAEAQSVIKNILNSLIGFVRNAERGYVRSLICRRDTLMN